MGNVHYSEICVLNAATDQSETSIAEHCIMQAENAATQCFIYRFNLWLLQKRKKKITGLF